jgi:alpha-beta hydrolase superfamily lysophospholipase
MNAPTPPHPSFVTRSRGHAAALALLAALLGYGGMLGYFYLTQEHLIFYPEPLPADFRFAFQPREQQFDEVRIPVPGGELHALHFRQPAPRGLVFFLHGNSGNLATWTTHIDFYRRINYDLFIVDYRGFGKSRGHIDGEDQLHADVRAAWDHVAPAYAGKPVVIYGRSLGTGLAIRLARDVHPALLVLVTPYTSLIDLTRLHYPLAPAWLLKYPLRSDTLIGDVDSPVFLLHGDRDDLTPLSHARRLLALARSPSQLVVVDGAAHGDIHEFPAYLEALANRLQELAP